jgi:Fibrinogen beta and gamma chains, C-terminal globular domain
MYWSFSIGSEANFYQLTVSGYDGRIGGDALDKDAGQMAWAANGQLFSTYDSVNDQSQDFNCARSMGGGWWYGWCSTSVLNTDALGSWLLLNRIVSSRMAICRI